MMENMTVVTIPKHLADRKDLVAVTLSDYKEFLVVQKALKTKKTFTATAREKRLIAQGRKEFKQGKFVSINEL